MKYFLDREGVLGLCPDGLDPEFVVLECEDNSCIDLRKLDDLIYLVRFNNEPNVKLVIFRMITTRVPRIIELNDVKDNKVLLLLRRRVFHKLLDFDSPSLSRRSRNIALTVIRSIIPQVVRGNFYSSGKDMDYHLDGNTMSVYVNNVCKGRFPYTSFTRNFKEKLLCSTH